MRGSINKAVDLGKKNKEGLGLSLLALILVAMPFFTYGNIVGILGLLLVLAASVLWEVRGGLWAASWGAMCLILSLFFSVYEVTQAHFYFYLVGIGLYFAIALGLGKAVAYLRRQHLRIKENEEKFRLVFEHSPFGELQFDKDGILTACNDNLVKIIGSSREALIGFDLLKLPDQKVVQAVTGSLQGVSTAYEGDYHSVTADKVTPVRASFAPLASAEKVHGGFGIVEDITERKQTEATLFYQLEFQKMVTKISASFVNCSAAEIDWAIDHALALSGEFFQADRSYLFQFAAGGESIENTHEWCAEGIMPQISRGKNVVVRNIPWWAKQIQLNETVHIPDVSALPPEAAAEQREFEAQGIQSLLSIPIIVEGKIRAFFGFDTVRQKKTWGKMEIHFLSVIGGILSSALAQHDAQEKLKYMSLHDALTGLYNRTCFEEELKRLQDSRDYPVTIISMDLDGLKLVNDTMGHGQGDDLLKDCARVIGRGLRKVDFVARVGGDEFVALLPRADVKAGEQMVERIKAEIARHNEAKDKLPLRISMGVATAADKGRPLAEALQEADHRMYRAKAGNGVARQNEIINEVMTVLGEKDFFSAQRLAALCHILGENMGLSPKQLSDITLLAHVHNLGMMGIPESILSKKGPLVAAEREVMRQHAEKGYRIAKSSPEIADIAELVLMHHERWDGTGYPRGVRGEDIPLECRIFAVAEAYDAMTHDRPYREAMRSAEAVAEIKNHAGSQFDPKVVEVFLENLLVLGISLS